MRDWGREILFDGVLKVDQGSFIQKVRESKGFLGRENSCGKGLVV